MNRSDKRILTTHVGALPRPQELGAMVLTKTKHGEHDEAKLAEWLRSAVSDVVTEQVKAGIDVISDGEYGKTNWTNYIEGRLGGTKSGSRRQGISSAPEHRRASSAGTERSLTTSMPTTMKTLHG